MTDIGQRNLAHVLAGRENCTDNDCELHNIGVAVDEEVINHTDLAMYLAGAEVMWYLCDCPNRMPLDHVRRDVEEWGKRLT